MSLKSVVTEYPVRVYGYSVVAALVALAVVTGFVSAGVAPLVMAVVAAVLAVPATEVVHSKVTPVANLPLPPK